jgi:transglutaminase-like putative cysteine protease
MTIARCFLGAALVLAGATATALSAEPNRRTFQFTYQAAVTGLQPGQAARIWLPVPPSNEQQEVTLAKKDLPGEGQIGKETKYGNQILYVEAKADQAGRIPLSVTYRVIRQEARPDMKDMGADAEELRKFLQPDAKVPLGGKCLTLVAGLDLPDDQFKQGRLFYDVVNRHMRYGKDVPGWGQGDAVWACDSKTGNCSDFHSLFIALARSHRIPARFEIGFPLPPKRGAGDVAGYHCWAWFKPQGKGWVPVDISEANKDPKMKEYYFGNLTADRVAFSTGRDLTLEPKQDGPPLNFFIYPYVEVDGKPYPADKVEKKFTYQDVGGK